MIFLKTFPASAFPVLGVAMYHIGSKPAEAPNAEADPLPHLDFMTAGISAGHEGRLSAPLFGTGSTIHDGSAYMAVLPLFHSFLFPAQDSAYGQGRTFMGKF